LTLEAKHVVCAGAIENVGPSLAMSAGQAEHIACNLPANAPQQTSFCIVLLQIVLHTRSKAGHDASRQAVKAMIQLYLTISA
jgi:hypothetical protein